MDVKMKWKTSRSLETYRGIVQTGLLHKIGPLVGACFPVVAVEKETRRKQQQQQQQQERKYCMETDWLTCGLDRLRGATERGCVCTCRIYMHRAMISRRSTRRGATDI
jgi:hypothetical protein